MKKAIGVVFFLCMFSVALFAEFVISPTIGYSNIMGKSSGYPRGSNTSFGSMFVLPSKISMNTFTFGIDMGYVGKNGFTFMFNNNISLLKKFKISTQIPTGLLGDKKVNATSDVKSVFWQANLLLGYTFKPIDDLGIVFASGLSGGFGKPTVKSLNVSDLGINTNLLKLETWMFNIGVPIQVSCNYYFTKNIGIGISLIDVIGWGVIQTDPLEYSMGGKKGFQLKSSKLFNDFTIKLGPVFKF